MKTGRKQRHHIDSKTGLPVIGLSRQTDGRWRIIGTATKFTEHDEQRAIEKFRNLKTHGMSQADIEAIGPIGFIGSGAFAVVHGFYLTKAPDALQRLWKWVGSEIRKAPLLAAQLTGIEEIGYFQNVKPPKPLPTFAELEQIWKTYFTKSKEQKRRVLHAFADFKKVTKATRIEDITPEVCIAYRDVVYARGLTGKMQQNIFSRIRRLFTFARERAVAIRELGEVIGSLELLKPSEDTINLAPNPISVADWKKLYERAKGENRAMILLMLNGGYYAQEVVRLRWDDIKDGCIVTNRLKKGKVVRACVLWPETIEALKAVPKKGEHIFISREGTPLGVKGAEKRFRKLRGDETPETRINVTSSQLRDGASTAMDNANINDALIATLMGHRRGIIDHYSKRTAKTIGPACKAIYDEYFT